MKTKATFMSILALVFAMAITLGCGSDSTPKKENTLTDAQTPQATAALEGTVNAVYVTFEVLENIPMVAAVDNDYPACVFNVSSETDGDDIEYLDIGLGNCEAYDVSVSGHVMVYKTQNLIKLLLTVTDDTTDETFGLEGSITALGDDDDMQLTFDLTATFSATEKYTITGTLTVTNGVANGALTITASTGEKLVCVYVNYDGEKSPTHTDYCPL